MSEMVGVKEPVRERAVVSTELTERRYVYGSTPPRSTPVPAAKSNRKAGRKQGLLFRTIATLLVISLLTVFYVWNKLSVNRLVIEVNDLQNQHQKILNASEILRAEIDRKSSLERIGKIATTQLGLIYPREQPVWFDINAESLGRLTE